MSRFYDALRQAGRPLPSGQKHRSSERERLSELMGFFSGFLKEPDAARPAEVETNSVASIAEKALASSADRRNGAGETPVQVALDAKARVLPNALDPAIMEQYRLLRTQILRWQEEKGFKSLLVTSPGPQEGKTVTVFNLAFACSLLPGYKVLVVEGDLRRGALDQLLGVGSRPGFSNLVEGSAAFDGVLLQSKEIPVNFILRGDSRVSPAELLHSPQVKDHIRKLTENYNLVLVDSPPVNLVTDTQLLASSCDAVLFVARMFRTSCRELAEAHKALLQHCIIGTVVNGGTRLAPYRGYRSYY